MQNKRTRSAVRCWLQSASACACSAGCGQENLTDNTISVAVPLACACACMPDAHKCQILSHCIALLQGEGALPACNVYCLRRKSGMHDIALLASVSGTQHHKPSIKETFPWLGHSPALGNLSCSAACFALSSETVTAVSLCC